jgi:glyoxylate reductase
LNQPKIFITRKIDSKAIEFLSQTCQVEVWDDPSPPDYSKLLEKATSKDGILTMLTDKIDRNLIHQPRRRVQVISQMAVGIDNIDLQAATEKKLPIGHTPGVLTESCADFTFALLLSIARRIVEANNEVSQGVWRSWGPDVLCGSDVYGSTLGIIGMGHIGKSVAKRARGFEMKVLYYSRNRHPDIEKELNARFLSLEELLQNSDFISIHVNLSHDTHCMISKNQFQMMKPTAYLINASRGAVVDPTALEEALENHIIAGAAIDVTDPEPIPVSSPLLKFKNLIVTPHIASASSQTRATMAMVAARNLLAGLQGERLPFCANPEIYS